MQATGTSSEADIWLPYLSRLHAEWLASASAEGRHEIDGTLVFADVSGFTPLTERLASLGKAGAEDLTDILNEVFRSLLGVASDFGGDCLKFGGDALLLLFSGPGHTERAAAAAHAMLSTLRPFRRLKTRAGVARINMSIGVHAGTVHAFLVGGSHRELIVTGPAVTETLRLEAEAQAGEILVSPDAAARLDPGLLGGRSGRGRLLVNRPASQPSETTLSRPIDAMDVLAGIPEALVGHLGAVEGGEHRLAAVGFLQFSQSDELLAASGPAALSDALHHLVVSVQEICSDHSVTFLASDCDKAAGKFLVATGTPASSNDDDDRLAHALRAMVDVATPLSLRAGANRGRVFSVDLGSRERRCFTVMGDVVNLAARVMAAAPASEVMVTRALTRQLRSEFELTAVAPFAVKGKSQPVDAALLGAPLVSARDIAANDLTLAGRHRELTILREAIAATRQGRGGVVELVGEAGVGKSRLLREATAEAHGLRVLTFEGGRYSRATPYLAVRRPLRELVGAEPDAGPDDVHKALRRTVEWVAPDLLPWLPLLGIPLGLDLPDTDETRRLDPTHRRSRLHAVALDLFERGVPGATLLSIEDAHWLDDASIDLIRHLVSGVRERPWVVLITRRDVAEGLHLPDDTPHTSLRLTPLGDDDAAALARSVAGPLALPPATLAKVIERSGGNPLFLQELVRTASSGTIDELPDTVEAVLAASIDRLPADERSLLRKAAVLGSRFPTTLLAKFVGLPERALRPRLAPLDRFLGIDAAGTIRFRHVLIREVAYEALAFRTRRDLHGRALEILESANRADHPVELLSLHSHCAGRFLDSWRHSREAGDRALRNGAPVEAVAFYERALEAGRNVPALPASDVAKVAEREGEAHLLAGNFPHAISSYRVARRYQRSDHLSRAELFRKEGVVNERAGQLTNALRAYRKAAAELDVIEETMETHRTRARVANGAGIIRLFQGRHAKALPLLEEAARDAERSGDQKVLAETFRLLDWTLIELDEPGRHNYGAQALAIFDEIGDEVGRSRQLQNFGVQAQYDGRWDEAVDFYERSSEAAARAGDSVFCALNLCNIGEVLSDQGHYARAEALFRDALDVFRGVHNAHRVALALGHLGRLAARTQRLDEAEAWLREARTIYPDVGAKGVLLLEVQAREIELLVLARQPAEALRRAPDLRAAVEKFGGVPYLLAMIDRLWGLALCQLGDVRSGWARLAMSLLMSRECKVQYEAALTMKALVAVAPLIGATSASCLTEEADEILAGLGVVETPDFPLALHDDQ